MSQGVGLLTIALNEMEWLRLLYAQHRDWPELRRWVFVEFADRAYAAANPEMVTKGGESTDGTTDYLEQLARDDGRVRHVKMGLTGGATDPLGKIPAKAKGLDLLSEVEPELVIVLDCDEFYTREHQARLLEVARFMPSAPSFIFLRREIWRPPCWASEPLMGHEVVGGFWQIPCCHWWRWVPGINFSACHNTPSDAQGRPLNDRIADLRELPDMPQMIHFGYAASKNTRSAKNRYYAQRGEARDPARQWYVKSRSAWRRWSTGLELPRDAKVVPYTGPVPEVFR